MEQGLILKKIDDAANKWNETKDPQYKDLWYKLIEEFVNGTYYPERWNVSINSIVKADDGTRVFIGTRKLHGSVRDTKTKTDNVRRQFKSTCHE